MSDISLNTALLARTRRWLAALAMVAGNLSSEMVNPWACRLIKPAQQRTQPAPGDRLRRAPNGWPHTLD